MQLGFKSVHPISAFVFFVFAFVLSMTASHTLLLAVSFITGLIYDIKLSGKKAVSFFLKIIMPMAKNTFFTVMLINFITFWNDYQTPLVYLPSYPTLALGMYRMSYVTINALSTVPMRMTAAIFMLIPTLVLFACFHKRLLGNLTVGGIKG